MGLGDVEERLSHGSPAWFYKGKRCLGMFADHHHGVDWVALWVPCPAGVAAGLVGSDEERFFVPPYVGVKAWVGVRLGGMRFGGWLTGHGNWFRGRVWVSRP